MNYLEFKKHFMQINSDKAFLLFAVDWIADYNVLVYGDTGLAIDMSALSNYSLPISTYASENISSISSMTIVELVKMNKVETIINAIMHQHTAKDIAVAFANQTTISLLLESVSATDFKTAFSTILTLNGSGEPCLAIDYNINYNHLVNLRTTLDKSNIVQDGQTNLFVSIGYNMAELNSYDIKAIATGIAFSISYIITSADSNSASDIISEIVLSDNSYITDAEVITNVYDFKTALLEEFIATLSTSNGIANDFNLTYGSVSRIMSKLTVNSTFISDIKDLYIIDVASLNLEQIMTNS